MSKRNPDGYTTVSIEREGEKERNYVMVPEFSFYAFGVWAAIQILFDLPQFFEYWGEFFGRL